MPWRKRELLAPRTLLFGLSFFGLVVCAGGAICHYRKIASGNIAQPSGWLLGMVFLLLAVMPAGRDMRIRLQSLIGPKALFFLFWIIVFVVSHLWNFKTAPWNGNGLFDESGWDLWFLKSYVIGHPFQAAWFHSPITRETLFHYFVWGFFRLFGFNILSYQAALFLIWFATFIFTILLVDFLFGSRVVTSLAALIFNFLPFAFIYTFAGYRYPMGTALAVISLYFLHRGFRSADSFHLALGGMSAGLCLASSITGKQYMLALVLFSLIYIAWQWKSVDATIWRSAALVGYAFALAATPILSYIIFNRSEYTLYEGEMVRNFWQAVRGASRPNDLSYYGRQLWQCFFAIPGPRFFIPDALPLPLPYYGFVLPGLILALWKKRYELFLLATIPVAAAFISGGAEHRLLLALPFWIVVMAFTFATVIQPQIPRDLRIALCAASALVLVLGLIPSVRYIRQKTTNPLSVHHYAQQQVAVARFFRNVIAGVHPANPPRLERDELNRVAAPAAPFDAMVCQSDAYSIIHLFLHDYDDAKILSFCDQLPMTVISTSDIWKHNKKAISDYQPNGKGLKLIWENEPKTAAIIALVKPLLSLAKEDSISFSFAGSARKFYVLNVAENAVPQFQARIRELPDLPH